MFVLVVAVEIGIIGCVLLCVHREKLDLDVTFVVCLVFLIGLGCLTYPIIRCVSGLMPEYSEGVREGYITKMSRKGVTWKTWEGQLQIGAGEQAAIQAPWDFSVSDDALARRVQESLGKRVVMHYREWLVMPYRVGDSGHEALSIELR